MPRAMTPDDVYLLRQVGECRLHPDGRRVAYVVGWCDRPTDSNRSQIWLHDGTSTRPLTYVHAATSPRFSPDGRWLAYCAAAHKGMAQLLVLPLDGGEPLAVAEFDDGCGEPAWLPDSSGLVVTAPTRDDDQRGLTLEQLADQPRPRRIDSTEYRYNGRGWINDRHRHVFLVSMPTAGGVIAPPVQLTDGPWDDSDPVPSPDGTRIVFVSRRDAPDEFRGGRDVFVVPRAGGQPTAVTVEGSGSGAWTPLRWLGDDRVVALGGHPRDGVRLTAPFVLPVDEPCAVPPRVGDTDTTSAGPLVVRGDALYLLAHRRGAVHLDRVTLSTGERVTLIGGRRQVVSFDVAEDGSIVVGTVTGSNTPAELIELADGVERVLTSHNAPFLDEVTLAEVEDIECVASDGERVHALLCHPASPGPHPALVYVHGGPLAQYGYGFFDEFQVAAAAGYVVIGANPRGSDGYGLVHARAIVGALGTVDWIDVQATADAVASRPDVDGSRVGIGGGSYGGFMAAWATGHTDRFRAALVERAVINWSTMEFTSDIGWFGALMTSASAFGDADALRRQSPLTYAPAVRTPTLVLHADEDWRCPPEQSEHWFAALRRNGVPVEYVRFPGENHELTRSGRPSFRVARFGLVHDFFSRYL